MKIFRINLYLSLSNFFKTFFSQNDLTNEKIIKKILKRTNNKKLILLTSQCRVSFLLILDYLKKFYKKKNEIIVCAYNLPEMINIATNLNFKVIYCDLNYENGFFNINELRKKITSKTSSVLLTNMFNNYDQSLQVKKLCKKKKIFLIEDNAIYFDNFSKKNGKRKFSGSLGDFSIYSFNIMKNISALYGGALATNDKNFYNFASNKINQYNNFPGYLLLKQSFIFFILKLLSVKFLYKNIFFYMIRAAHLFRIKFLLVLFYPSLKFKKIKFPNFYFTKLTNFSKSLIYLQLVNLKKRLENQKIRKKNNIYYYKKFSNLDSKHVRTIKIKDFDFQNFIDFPVLVKRRDDLNKYLLENGIEARVYYYKNCEKIFSKRKVKCKNTNRYDQELICFPNHKKIGKNYIDYLTNKILAFYKT